MANSTRYDALIARMDTLRATFLPAQDQFDPTGSYEQPIFDRATAYRLLVHAEFESFIEDIIKETVQTSFDKWRSEKKVSLPLVCMISSYEGHERINNFTDNQLNSKPITLMTLLHKAFRHFEHNITSNNSIRTKNVLSLLVQVGIEDTDLDATWLGTIDAFGAHRNVIGHNSGHVAYQADPKTALDTSIAIREGLKNIDEKLLNLRTSILSQ